MDPFAGTAAGGMDPAHFDESEVRRFLSLVVKDYARVHLQRLPPLPGSSRLFAGSDLDGMVEFARRSNTGDGVYYGINPVKEQVTGTIKDPDIQCRRLLLLDVDRNKNIAGAQPATAYEKAQAGELTYEILEQLSCRGWPAPLVVDSGNGFHLLYGIDLPNDHLEGKSRDLIQATLHKLHALFSDQRGRVGAEVYDARRIAKLPGTMARRGTETTERPFRLCRLQAAPEQLGILTENQLRSFAGPPTPPEGKSPVAPVVLDADPFAGWAQTPPLERARRYVAHMPAAVSRTPNPDNGKLGHDTTFDVALTLARGFALSFAEGYPLLQEYNQRCQPPWSDRDLQHKWASAEKQGRAPLGYKLHNPAQARFSSTAAAVSSTPTFSVNGVPNPAEPRPPAIYRMTDLVAMELPPTQWAIPGLMAQGLTILAGKPKLGKSWMALNMAMTLAVGGKAMGSLDTVPGDVLYLSLEDRLRRVQDRARKLMRGMSIAASERMHVAVEWPKQEHGGLQAIKQWLESVPHPRLIVIDIWVKFRPRYRAAGNLYDQDADFANAVKDLADAYNCSILVLHHCKKAPAEDVFDEISGSLGFAGAADGLMVLVRSRGENEGKLVTTGRDADDKELAVTFNPDNCVWTVTGTTEERDGSRVAQSILQMLRGAPGSYFFPKQVAEILKIPDGTAKCTMWRLFQDGFLERKGQGKYAAVVTTDVGAVPEQAESF